MRYSKLGWTAVIAAFAVSIGAVPAAAKGGNAKAKQPTVRVTSAKAKPVKVAKAGPSTTAGAKAKAPTPKVASGSGATKANGSRTASAKPGSTPTLTSGTPTKPTSNTPTTSSKPAPSTDRDPKLTGTTPLTTDRMNKAQQLLMKNDNLRMKMQTRLGGMDPILAASDFRNLGQFVAAVNASYNDPTIQFLALKALMTGDPPMSLGQAKQQLRGTAPAVTTPTLTTVTTTTDQK